jgi:hypothetical protein
MWRTSDIAYTLALVKITSVICVLRRKTLQAVLADEDVYRAALTLVAAVLGDGETQSAGGYVRFIVTHVFIACLMLATVGLMTVSNDSL